MSRMVQIAIYVSLALTVLAGLYLVRRGMGRNSTSIESGP